MIRLLTVLFILCFTVTAYTVALLTPEQLLEQDRQQKLDDLVAACTQARIKDPICDTVITIKQIGNDSVEFIKEYMNLSPPVYRALTLLNFLATGRVRIRAKSFLLKKADHIYDLQNDQFTFTIEKKF